MRTLEVEFLGEFKSIFENALVYKLGDQLGTFGEITLDKKISSYCPFNLIFLVSKSARIRPEGIHC